MPEDIPPSSCFVAAQSVADFDTCTISDALDKLGFRGAVAGIVRLTANRQRIAGRVVTVKLGPAMEGLPKRHLGASAIMAAQPGEIVVVEHRGRTDASGWGGLLSRGALRKGIAGVIVDGACRDLDESSELGFPVFGRAVVPLTARGRVAEHDWGCPVTIGSIVVNPGDWVVADGSGVVFVEQQHLDKVLAEAERIQGRETAMITALEQGAPIDRVMGANYEDMLK
ncbi:RraA family protein [Novosphingobium sp. PP1Y]|uniref:RraA family protein n=1 Tax=Novosphingobium sp. PP1Y TaxID=702113 RepID=UPI00020EEC2A|nr:RraA family protein [Novosphingobium sp. PP1Y]CCA92472.1 dimethylmenaquinone methyltransferase [Novosphingobium sp. PP1Y]